LVNFGQPRTAEKIVAPVNVERYEGRPGVEASG
jgi:hypothetical protein